MLTCVSTLFKITARNGKAVFLHFIPLHLLLWFVFKLGTLFLIDVQAPQAMHLLIHIKDYSSDSSEE